MKKLFLLLSVATFSANLIHSQTENTDPKIKFGFNICSNYSYLQLDRSINVPPVREISEFGGAGFKIGILMDLKLNERFSFIPKSEMSFNSAGLSFLYDDGTRVAKQVLPTTVDLTAPLAIRLGDKRKSYVLIGPGAKIPLTEKKPGINVSDINATAFSLDIGFASDRALKYFILSPEIRYSYGLNNLSNIPGISKLQYHSITLALNFKG